MRASPAKWILIACMALALASFSQAQPFSFTTLAGSAGEGSTDGSAASARFSQPGGVARDPSGNLYVADTANHVIRKISGGVVTTFAGLAGVSGSDNGVGGNARFNGPMGLAVDANGIIYVADTGNHAIRKVLADGTVSTLAGLAGSPGSANGSGGVARLFNPEAIAVKADGSLIYVADTWNHTIRQITSGGAVTTLAGTAGTSGSTGSLFYQPSGIALDNAGNIYVSDTGNGTIRKVTSGGSVSLLAGSAGNYGSANGNGVSAQFYMPMGLAVDASGVVYVADSLNHTVRSITAAGTVSTLSGLAGNYGSTDGAAASARFYTPQGIAVSGGTVYVADTGNGVIRQIASGNVSTVAGSASIGSADGTGIGAKFFWPRSAVVDAGGNVFVSDTFNHTIRKITPDGVVTTLAGSVGVPGANNGIGVNARFYGPQGIALDSGGFLYVADTANHLIRKITPAGLVSTLAGSGVEGVGDGSGVAAQFSRPQSLAVDASGNVYVADTGNHTIRKIGVGGGVTTLAGVPGVAGNLDSNMANYGTNVARFNSPAGVAVDGSGNLYVADTGNHIIRKVTAAGVVTTLAGLPGVWGNADGMNRNARFYQPQGITVDGSGNLFVMDSGNHTIRMLTPSGTNWIVTTIGGQTDVGGSADGVGAAALFYYPGGIGLNSSGFIVIADSGNSVVRAVQPAVTRFEQIVPLANGSVFLSMSGRANTNYTLLTTTDGVTWSSLASLPSGNGSFQYTDSTSTPGGVRLYRLRLGP